MSVSKATIVSQVSEKAGLTKKESEAAISALLETVQESLVAGETVSFVGFGSFEVRERAARKGRNPQTGEELQIAASKMPAFKAGKGLKDAVNK